MEIGSAVISKAGSDAGKTYIVVGFDQRGYALLVDGNRHSLSAPKCKNIKHLTDTGAKVNIPKTDSAFRTAIRRLPPSAK